MSQTVFILGDYNNKRRPLTSYLWQREQCCHSWNESSAIILKNVRAFVQILVERAKPSALTPARCQKLVWAIDTKLEARVRIFEEISLQFILVPAMNHFVNGYFQHLG